VYDALPPPPFSFQGFVWKRRAVAASALWSIFSVYYERFNCDECRDGEGINIIELVTYRTVGLH
jgi:hypothetical protein